MSIDDDQKNSNTPPPVEEEAKTLPPISLNLANRKRRPTLKVDVTAKQPGINILAKTDVELSIKTEQVDAA